MNPSCAGAWDIWVGGRVISPLVRSLRMDHTPAGGESRDAVDAQAVVAYRNAAKASPELSLAQEQEILAHLLAQPEQREACLARLVEGTMQRAEHVARSFQGKGLPFAELLGEANSSRTGLLAVGSRFPAPWSWVLPGSQVLIVDAESGKTRAWWACYGTLLDLVWSPTGEHLATVTQEADDKWVLTIWSMAGSVVTQREIRQARWVHWSRERLSVLSQDGWLSLVDPSTGRENGLHALPSHEVARGCWSADGLLALALVNEPGIWLWKHPGWE